MNPLHRALFQPRRIALIGASSDPKRLTARAQLYLRKHGYTGDVLPVHPRESEVLDLMAQGLSNTAIGGKLVVSQGAVEKHIGNIFAKLGLEVSAEEHRRVRAVLTYLGRT